MCSIAPPSMNRSLIQAVEKQHLPMTMPHHIDCPPKPRSTFCCCHCVFKKCFPHFSLCLLPLSLSLRRPENREKKKKATVLWSHSFRPAPRKKRYFQVDWKFNFVIFLFFKEIQRDVARVSALFLNKLHVFLTYVKSCANIPCLCLHCVWISVVQPRTRAW